MTAGTAVTNAVEHARELPEPARRALRDLVLTLADCKRLLGIRFSDFILCAPTLESGIAAASMAQDEWGHARQMYAVLADFGDDPKALEHERDAADYRSSELLDTSLRSWADVIALGLLFDTALSVQYASLAESRYTPVRTRVQKMLDEERFHFQHAVSWTRRLARADAAAAELSESLRRVLPVVLRWFGRPEDDGVSMLVEHGLVTAGTEANRDRLLASVCPLLDELGLCESLGVAGDSGDWRFRGELDWAGWNAAARRAGDGEPDADTIARVRGDRNRAFLMD